MLGNTRRPEDEEFPAAIPQDSTLIHFCPAHECKTSSATIYRHEHHASAHISMKHALPSRTTQNALGEKQRALRNLKRKSNTGIFFRAEVTSASAGDPSQTAPRACSPWLPGMASCSYRWISRHDAPPQPSFQSRAEWKQEESGKKSLLAAGC